MNIRHFTATRVATWAGLLLAFAFSASAQPIEIQPGQRLFLQKQLIQGRIVNHGTLTLSRCILRGNQTDEPGGAIENRGRLVLDRCTLEGNTVYFTAGGAIFNHSPGKVFLYRCLLTGNRANHGGAIYNLGQLDVASCLFTNNGARFSGGAIASDAGAVHIWRSLFYDNGCGDGAGGAIDNRDDSVLWLSHCQVRWNYAHIYPGGCAGGGISNGATQPAVLHKTIVSDNLSFTTYLPDPEHNDLCGEFIVRP